MLLMEGGCVAQGRYVLKQHYFPKPIVIVLKQFGQGMVPSSPSLSNHFLAKLSREDHLFFLS
jgi:hypothetical protein